MSAYPDNVIVLDDYRHTPIQYSYEPFEMPRPTRPDLKLITGPDTPSEPFGLEVFLRRAMIVMAAPPQDPAAPVAPLIPLHAPASA